MWRIEQVRSPEHFERYRADVLELLQLYRSILLDDSCEDLNGMLENLAASLAFVWLLIHQDAGKERAMGLTSLTDIIVGRHAFIHGLSHPAIRRHPMIGKTAFMTMDYAFETFKLLKIKAEFEADNLAAKGFCLRMGFEKEGHFKADNLVNGVLKDVLIYSLPKTRYEFLQWRHSHGR